MHIHDTIRVKAMDRLKSMKMMTALILAMLAFWNPAFGQHAGVSSESSGFDSSLARSLGADEYGMKHYVMAFLKAGPVKIQDPAQKAELQREHLRNIIRLANQGTLLIAGPFLDDQSLRGIFIFNVESIEEAKSIAQTDPAVKAGTLVLELHPWYGSAALVEMPRIHKRLEKRSVAE